jgi:hypothetical protein
MLAADKAALMRTLKLRAMEIQEKELNFYVDNLHSIAHQAALLAGFSLAALMLVGFKGVEGTSKIWKVTYYLVTAIAMTCELTAVTMSTICTIEGPGLALRGPHGSMKVVRFAHASKIPLSQYIHVHITWRV